ncbi:MAG: sulfotransferase [Flavobacteriales bacterium]|nr:sulfotransferase [Flavobacteriales bacterium]
MSRSGTTLLLSILNVNQQTLCIPEIPISVYGYSKYKNKTNFSSNDARIWIELKSKINPIRQIGVDESLLKTSIEQANNYNEYLLSVYASIKFPDKKNEQAFTRIIDKDHIHTFQTQLLKTIFPKAKYILLVRNPLAFVNSSIEHADNKKLTQSIFYYAAVWKAYASEILKLISSADKEKYLLVQYEDLVSEPEKTLKVICSHLEMEFSPEMLNLSHSKFNSLKENNVLTPEQIERKNNKFIALQQSINSDRINSWEGKFSQEEQHAIIEKTNELALKLNYSLPTIQNSKVHKSAFIEWKVKLYFKFAKRFYFLPLWLREKYKVKL